MELMEESLLELDRKMERVRKQIAWLKNIEEIANDSEIPEVVGEQEETKNES